MMGCCCLAHVATKMSHLWPLAALAGIGVSMRSGDSVVAALSWHFAILVNKICKIIKIFEQLDNLRNQWVLCQH